jgi:hypothetical protein
MTDHAEMITDLSNRIADLSRIVNPASACIESHGWIVTYPGSTTAYSFTVIPHATIENKFTATALRMDKCESCSRFTKQDAERVAADCTSPNGLALVARHYRDVCKQELPALQDLLEMLTARAA